MVEFAPATDIFGVADFIGEHRLLGEGGALGAPSPPFARTDRWPCADFVVVENESKASTVVEDIIGGKRAARSSKEIDGTGAAATTTKRPPMAGVLWVLLGLVVCGGR